MAHDDPPDDAGRARYAFASLSDLLAKATPARSGDVLAGIAAESQAQRVAAQYALADVPLATFLDEPVVPYEDDDVTRLILDTHDPAAFAPVAALTVGELPRLAAVATPADAAALAGARARAHARDGRRGLQAHAQRRTWSRSPRKCRVVTALPHHARAARAGWRPGCSPTTRPTTRAASRPAILDGLLLRLRRRRASASTRPPTAPAQPSTLLAPARRRSISSYDDPHPVAACWPT